MGLGPRPPLPQSFTPPAGSWQYPSHLASVPVAGSPVSGVVSFTPLDVGPVSDSYSAIGVNVSTAQAGGTTTTTLGVYRDIGNGGQPLTAGGPLASGTVTLTATGVRSAALSLLLAPGRYWLASLYVATAAPTTVAQVSTIGAGTTGLWFSTIANAAVRALQLTGQTALPTTAVTLTATASTPILVALQGA